jgi:two-component system OmpR family sensor kinase
MRSIRQQLLIGLAGAGLVTALAAGAVLYRQAHHEATELADLQLRQMADGLPLQLGAHLELPEPGEPEEVLFVQIWDDQGLRLYQSDGAPPLPRQLPGFHSAPAGGDEWRVYTAQGKGRVVQVSQADAVRATLAFDLTWRIFWPLLLFVPFFGALVYIVVGRVLRPLERVAQAVAGRSPTSLAPLESARLSPDLQPIVGALNTLFEQIDQAMTAQRQFVADAAHELRSPLTALKLQLQLVERATDDGARGAAIGKLHERLDRASHLVRQMLTLARHDADRHREQLEPVDLHLLAQRTVTDHAAAAELRAIDLGLDAASRPVTVHGNADGLGVLLGNLVDNAARYTQAGGQVDVHVGAEQGRGLLRVSDNGPGVPAAERERLFDRFYRPEGNQAWGSGLGMSIVKNVADRHGAEIRLGAGLGGRGFSVTVLFPGALAELRTLLPEAGRVA